MNSHIPLVSVLLLLTASLYSGDAVKLEYKFTPGEELTYKSSDRMKVDIKSPARDMKANAISNGHLNITAIKTDVKKNSVLLLEKQTIKTTGDNIKRPGQKIDETKTFLRACNLDFLGKNSAILEHIENGNMLLRIFIGQLNSCILSRGQLPGKAVKPGNQWTASTALPLIDAFTIKIKTTSTLKEIKDVKGKKCAIIVFKVISGTPTVPMPFVISGGGNIRFDIDAGILLENIAEYKVDFKNAPGGMTGGYKVNHFLAFESKKTLDKKQFAAAKQTGETLNLATLAVFKGKGNDALQLLDKLKTGSSGWKKGIAGFRKLVAQINQFTNRSVSGPRDNGLQPSKLISFEPKKFTISRKNIKALNVLKEIEKFTGNKVALAANYKNPVLKSFEIKDATFWEAMDKLCKLSGNSYAKQACGGGG